MNIYDKALNALAQPAEAPRVSALPDTAKAISSKTYVLGPNVADIESLRLAANDTAEAKLYMKLEGVDVAWPIGLDGKYRVAPSGQALRGYWADPETYIFEMFEDGASTFRLHFEDDRLELSSPEHGLKVVGQIENP